MEELALASAAVALLEKLAPRLQEAFKSDPILAAEQAALCARYQALAGHAAFQGAEWEKSTTTARP